MGGGYYSQDVAHRARSNNQDAFTYDGYIQGSDEATSRRTVHEKLNPYGKTRECLNETPIVVAMDVTRSRGNDSKVVYEKLPMLIGQIELKGYVEGAGVSFAAIGDATDGDQAPLQVGQFEADNRLDEVLSCFWLEEGGGGSGRESYELAAYYYARHTTLACEEQGKKGYFFFVGDEGFYPKVDKKQIKEILGFEESKSIDSEKIFKELQKKFHVFFIYPQKSWEDRKSDIDAEIKKRVEAAGGLYEGVDIRASLLWNDRNDLDIHLVCPSGEEISYSHKQSACGGWLDVDMNVNGETTKPVENIRWKKGEAPAGRYKVFVQNYGFHESKQTPTEFKVEVEIHGQVQHFTGVTSPNGETGTQSNVTVYEFDFDPAQSPENEENPHSEAYAMYDDEVIHQQWASVLPEENILPIEEPEAIIDVLLGTLALVSGTSDLDAYLVDMKNRNQTSLRQNQAAKALEYLSSTTKSLTKVQMKGTLPSKKSSKKRKGGSVRL